MRVRLDSRPEEIDNIERKIMQLIVEVHALEKEKDKSSKARLVEVSIDRLFHLHCTIGDYFLVLIFYRLCFH